ncbi:GNAT family N-acetyltransferase [Pseudomonas triticifolii]|uniref:GNAT family N-acetyltransferase n=1 Tax=Pseudomonas triticifolii TaxID=2762592 RepID=A0ABR7BG77_9PSED|nr:GNAT family N-acetyltransferase [Pseudomonas triticifolii]MBC3956188.1 GNAT family N-acetyltransferase [Pseudomonas triticifolii]
MNCQIRPAVQADAEAISGVIVSALHASNAQDYPPSVIERVQHSFSPAAVRALIMRRRVFVAVCGGVMVGTASLDGRAVRSVFVDPAWHRQGVGRRLMDEVERAAVEAGVSVLVVPSSLTAQGFYAALGFTMVREQLEGEERTLIMERVLKP